MAARLVSRVRALLHGAPRPSARPPSPSPRWPLRRRLLAAGLAGGAALGAGLALRALRQRERQRQRLRHLRRLALGGRAALAPLQRVRPDTGTDNTEDAEDEEDAAGGGWALLYFGFTHCPDVCPEALERLSDAVRLLERLPALPRVQPLFVSVDPARDDAPALARYLRGFHPRLRALAGSAEQLSRAARAFRVYHSAGPPDADGDYLVDHSVLIYLLGPDGLCLDYYARGKSAEDIARSVRRHMESYEPLPPE